MSMCERVPTAHVGRTLPQGHPSICVVHGWIKFVANAHVNGSNPVLSENLEEAALHHAHALSDSRGRSFIGCRSVGRELERVDDIKKILAKRGDSLALGGFHIALLCAAADRVGWPDSSTLWADLRASSPLVGDIPADPSARLDYRPAE